MPGALTVGSLFSGIGGLDLGLQRAGMRVIWHSEIQPYCCRVLQKHWPGVPNHGDITQINPQTIERPDVLAGGFPCQDISCAGKRAGINGARSGLWREFARLIRGLRPRYVLVENVPALLVEGMGRVLGDLAACGYDAEWQCVPAAAVGAPHLRDRVFILAYPHPAEWRADAQGRPDERHGPDARGRETASGLATRRADGGTPVVADAQGQRWRERRAEFDSRQRLALAAGGGGALPDAAGGRQPRHAELDGAAEKNPACGSFPGHDLDGFHHAFPDAARHGLEESGHFDARLLPATCGGWEAEPGVGRVVDGLPHRVDRLRGLGNAVVPQVAEFLGRFIVQHAETQHGRE